MKSPLGEAPVFCGGPNIAMKIPPRFFNDTLVFYRDVLKLPAVPDESLSHVFRFGSSLLWLDSVEGITTTEIWLELTTSDTAKAATHFARHDIERCDNVEILPLGFDGFWIRAPSSVVHLVTLPTGP